MTKNDINKLHEFEVDFLHYLYYHQIKNKGDKDYIEKIKEILLEKFSKLPIEDRILCTHPFEGEMFFDRTPGSIYGFIENTKSEKYYYLLKDLDRFEEIIEQKHKDFKNQ